MKFHSTHGSAISLSQGRSTATRDRQSFCNGIVFGDQPLKVGQKVCLQLGCVSNWSGALRLGVTIIDPGTLSLDDLPKYAYPDLTLRDGFWSRAVPERLVCEGCRVMVYVTSSGQLQAFVNGQHKGVLLTRLPVMSTLWLLADVYGNTIQATFVKPEDAPREILTRGFEAMQAYDQACTHGTQPVFRTRLMLVGKDRVGKTSLKRALMGQHHNASEESTDGIDLSASCSFNLVNRSSWKLAIKGDTTAREERMQDRLDLGVLGGPEGLEEEYHQAVAANIVQELVFQRCTSREPSTTSVPSFTPIASSNNNNSARTLRSTSFTRSVNASAFTRNSGSGGSTTTQKLRPTAHVDSSGTSLQESTSTSFLSKTELELSSEVPERVAQLVQEMLEDLQWRNSEANNLACAGGVSEKQVSLEKQKNVVMNIWDFAGQAVYYTTHQVFLTSRAVYVIVFNLCDDLSPPVFEETSRMEDKDDLTTLEYMDFWMHSIHSHAAENTSDSMDSSMLSPPIVVVGTHRNSLHDDPTTRAQMVEEKFSELLDFLTGKPYTHHLVTPFFAVENSLKGDEEIMKVKEEIEKVAGQQPYMGEQMPLRWLRCEQELTQQADNGCNCATLSQVSEMARNHGVDTNEELSTMLTFYHDLGVLIHYGAMRDGSSTHDSVLANTVVLSPQWLTHKFRHVVTGTRPIGDEWKLKRDKWEQLETHGVLDVCLLRALWPGEDQYRPVLLGLMQKLDLLCPLASSVSPADSGEAQKYSIPMRLPPCFDIDSIYIQTADDVVFCLDFYGFLPDGLFFRIMNRTLRWSQERGGRDQCLRRRVARFYFDPDHDLVIHLTPRQHRIKVVVMNVGQQEATSFKRKDKPKPETCALVRNFLESTLVDLRHLWMKRIGYQICVACPCERICEEHKTEACPMDSCQHFLNLDECLSSKVVCCDHRRVKTDRFQDWFPKPSVSGFQTPVVPNAKVTETYGNIEKHMADLPGWMKGAAKLLNSGDISRDWAALAQLLGYKATRIERLMEDVNPPLALLTDWVVSNGNTSMAVDLLTFYLQQLGRLDIVLLIQRAKENESPVAQVFLSYQWETQDQVRSLRDHLERLGYACWMDVGQMGGGDHLNAKIEKGLRNCKVVIAFLTPHYVASELCTRELCLADLLQKPIVPVMLHPVPWPPPGPLALVLAQMVYINMQGVGGHGGTGIHADLRDKYGEIVQRVTMYAEPTLVPCIHLSQNSNQQKNYTDNVPGQAADYYTPGRTLSVGSSLGSGGGGSDLTRRVSASSNRDPSVDVLLSRISPSRAHMPPPRLAETARPVSAAQVMKCTVCVIL